LQLGALSASLGRLWVNPVLGKFRLFQVCMISDNMLLLLLTQLMQHNVVVVVVVVGVTGGLPHDWKLALNLELDTSKMVRDRGLVRKGHQ